MGTQSLYAPRMRRRRTIRNILTHLAAVAIGFWAGSVFTEHRHAVTTFALDHLPNLPFSIRSTASSDLASRLLQHEEDPSKYRPGGYCPVHIGQPFHAGRYVVRRKLGFGEYSTVWLAEDTSTHSFVALKILTANSTVGETELDELNILRHVSRADPTHPGFAHVIALADSFRHEGLHGTHICLVFDVMGSDLNGLIDARGAAGIPLDTVKSVARQVLSGLDYLHTTCGIIHSDIKPANVLMTLGNAAILVKKDLADHPPVISALQTSLHPPHANFTIALSQPLPVSHELSENVTVKIADLGVGNWVERHFVTLIQAVPYRAPEVVLNAPWDTTADLWSTACMIFLMLTGTPLFHEGVPPGAKWTGEEEHLAQMVELLGPVPAALIPTGADGTEYLHANGTLRRIDGVYPSPLGARLAQHGFEEGLAREIETFLLPMLRYEPARRVSAREALGHAWLRR